MNYERKLIISLLRLTKTGAIPSEVIRKDAKIPTTITKTLLEHLQNHGLVYLENKIIDVDHSSRLKLALQAINLGADLQYVCSLLDWKEFEAITATAFENNGYAIKRNLRFKHGGRRWEMDIVGGRKPILVCADCKHWHYGMYPATMRKIVAKQVDRTKALAESWPELAIKIGCESWRTAKLLPAVLSLTTARFKFHSRVPIVPILMIQDFISQLPAHLDMLKHFRVQDQSVNSTLVPNA